MGIRIATIYENRTSRIIRTCRDGDKRMHLMSAVSLPNTRTGKEVFVTNINSEYFNYYRRVDGFRP